MCVSVKRFVCTQVAVKTLGGLVFVQAGGEAPAKNNKNCTTAGPKLNSRLTT